MSAASFLGSFQDAHQHLVTRTNHELSPVYLNLVFKAYMLVKDNEFALAYFFLIVLGIVERLLALAIDSIRDKPGQPWRIFPRACLYFVVTLIRYVLMIAIMNVYIPMFLIIILGLALGQILVEAIRYWLMMRRLKQAGGDMDDTAGFSQIKTPDTLSSGYKLPPGTSHVSEACC
ncbi:hypothetical protein GQ54DRAFT_296426 [Martensiomyces pterosporus]|nr:hypothetical protein GQ54DRAFT_296426 [Martensiomyces pterosporus]